MFTLAVHRVEWFSAGVSSSKGRGTGLSKPRELSRKLKIKTNIIKSYNFDCLSKLTETFRKAPVCEGPIKINTSVNILTLQYVYVFDYNFLCI